MRCTKEEGGEIFIYESMPCGGICYLLGAGPLYGYEVKKRPQDMLIAADGGYVHAQRLGVVPDVLLGDFDSLGHVPSRRDCLVLPQEKDDTDMIAAARLGIEKGYRYFCLLGGTGGRIDHTLANIQLLAFLAEKGARGWLAAEQNIVTLLNQGEICYPSGLRGYVSVLAYGQEARVSLEGLKYVLKNAVLTPAFPLGTSNEFLGTPARIAVKKGSVLIIYPRTAKGEEEKIK